MKMLPGMSDAMRLMRAGRLTQSMAVIQQALRGETAPFAQAAPGAAQEPVDLGRFESHAYSNHAGTRQYRLYVPADYQQQPMPLVVMLHGCTQSPEDFAAGTRMNELAEAHGFLVAYPEQAKSANPNKCWNWFRHAHQERERGEPSIIAGIVDAVKSRYAVHDREVYVAGLSSGGAMAATVTAVYPDVFAAVGVHSGLPHGSARDLPSALAAMRSGGTGQGMPANVPTIIFHGDRDSVVHPSNGEALVEHWLSRNPGAAIATDSGADASGYGYTRRSVSDASGRPELEHWVIHGAGHAWSGGSPSGTHTDPRGPDASSEMLRFFLARRAA